MVASAGRDNEVWAQSPRRPPMRVPACERPTAVPGYRRPVPSQRFFERIAGTANSPGRPALLVSACLLGVKCDHEGGHSRHPAVEALAADYRVVPVCPEACGGLSTPRPAAERVGDRIVNVDGADVTAAYERGAHAAVELAQSTGARARGVEGAEPLVWERRDLRRVVLANAPRGRRRHRSRVANCRRRCGLRGGSPVGVTGRLPARFKARRPGSRRSRR